MPRLQYAQLRYLAIILLTSLAVFFLTRSALMPLSVAWGATTSPAPLQGVCPANWAYPVDTRINLYRMAPDLYRTRLIAALYRVIYQDWSEEQELAEMAGGGFGGEDRMGDAERYLRDADIPALRSALTTGVCGTSPWARCALKARLLGAIEGA